MHLQPNTLFHDRYYLQELKGRGSFGEVWLAKDQQLDIDVAVKVYISLDSRGVEEFRTEYKTTFGLSHPNLLHALHFDICEDRPYLVMPYCPSSAMNYIGNIDEPTLWRFLHDVASGLEYLHGMGIIHHDIKPDNILMDTNGNFVITDFGISVKFRSTLRRISSRQVNTGSRGSMPYMAPEMFAETPEAVNATDIWALGVTMYELMTGELPFFGQGGSMQLNGAKVPDVPGAWSDDLKQVVKMCLAANTWERPTAGQLASYAQTAIGGGKISFGKNEGKNVTNEKAGAGNVKKKPRFMWPIIGVVAVVLIAVLLTVIRKPKPTPNEQKVKETSEVEAKDTTGINADYAASVVMCRNLIDQGSAANPKPLVRAKEELACLSEMESKHGDILDSIVSPELSNELLPKLKEAAWAWADAAQAQSEIGDMDKALEFFQLSLSLYEDQKVKETVNKLTQ
jgi:serine/threonine protein kinase